MPPKARSGDIQRTLPVTSDASFTKKKWRPSDRSYVYRFSDHRTNSVSTPGMIPKDGLTLYPTKGNLSSNMVDWKRALILLVSKQYPHLDDVLRTERYTPAVIPSMSKAEENQLSDSEKELKIIDAKDTDKEDDSDDDVLSMDSGVGDNTHDPGVGDNTHNPGVGDNAHNPGVGDNTHNPGVDNNTCDHDDSDVLSVDPGVGDNTHDPGVDYNTCKDEDHDDVNNSGEDEDNDDVHNSGEDEDNI